jgi:transporter family-2 protein
MQGQSIAFYAAVSTVAGVLIPILAALSGALGRTLDNPWTASAIVITGAFAMVLAVTLATGSAHISWDLLKQAKPLQLVAGFGMAFYLLSATWLAPRFGVGNFVMFVLVGQLVISAAIDHFGLFGAPQKPVDALRLLGVGVMIIGVVIAQMSASAARPAS